MSTSNNITSAPGKNGFQLPKWAGSFGVQIIAALIIGLVLGLIAKYTGMIEFIWTGIQKAVNGDLSTKDALDEAANSVNTLLATP